MDSNDNEVNENATWRQLSYSLHVIFPSYFITCFDIVCNGALNWIVESIEESDKDIEENRQMPLSKKKKKKKSAFCPLSQTN